LAAYIQARNLNLTFRPPQRAPVRALAHFDIDVEAGEFLSIVGPSGCGKSTFLNVLLGLLRPDSGDVTVDGRRISGPGTDRAMVFQEFGLLPWRTVAGNVELGLELKRLPTEMRRDISRRLIEMVGLAGFEGHYPHELSGGMKQRACIAIATCLRPKVIIADEPTSALDVVVQRQVMATLARVQQELGAAVILIGHDMGLMAQFVDRLGVMYAGRLVEVAPIAEIITRPSHPYTRALIASLPSLEMRAVLAGIPGLAPLLRDLPPGCAFHPRCTLATDRCRTEKPSLRGIEGAQVACHLA
jgi:oligopeptide/dipeptide ABC transporter ATP-binding protein